MLAMTVLALTLSLAALFVAVLTRFSSAFPSKVSRRVNTQEERLSECELRVERLERSARMARVRRGIPEAETVTEGEHERTGGGQGEDPNIELRRRLNGGTVADKVHLIPKR